MTNRCNCGSLADKGKTLCPACLFKLKSEQLKPCINFDWKTNRNCAGWCIADDKRTSIKECHQCKNRILVREDNFRKEM